MHTTYATQRANHPQPITTLQVNYKNLTVESVDIDDSNKLAQLLFGEDQISCEETEPTYSDQGPNHVEVEAPKIEEEIGSSSCGTTSSIASDKPETAPSTAARTLSKSTKSRALLALRILR